MRDQTINSSSTCVFTNKINQSKNHHHLLLSSSLSKLNKDSSSSSSSDHHQISKRHQRHVRQEVIVSPSSPPPPLLLLPHRMLSPSSLANLPGRAEMAMESTNSSSTSSSSNATCYFSRKVLDFGSVALGGLSRLSCNLCNSSPRDAVTVFISDPPLPFLVSCNEVSLRPASYTSIAFRFLPVTKDPRTFEATVVAQFKSRSSDGSDTTQHIVLYLTGGGVG